MLTTTPKKFLGCTQESGAAPTTRKSKAIKLLTFVFHTVNSELPTFYQKEKKKNKNTGNGDVWQQDFNGATIFSKESTLSCTGKGRKTPPQNCTSRENWTWLHRSRKRNKAEGWHWNVISIPVRQVEVFCWIISPFLNFFPDSQETPLTLSSALPFLKPP